MKGTEKRLLKVDLTISESNQKAKELAEQWGKLESVVESKKNVTKQFNDAKKKIEMNIAELSESVETGTEIREVECEWEFNWTHGKKVLRRLDTCEIVVEDDIADHEKQMDLEGELN